MHLRQKNKGFTLVELIIVIGIIAILAVSVIIAINPGKHFASTRDTVRESHIKNIEQAILSYQIDNYGSLPQGIPSNQFVQIGTEEGMYDLYQYLFPEYISSFVIDPQRGVLLEGDGYVSKYSIKREMEKEGVILSSPISETRLIYTKEDAITLKFNGTNSYINIGTPVLSGKTFTVSAWINHQGYVKPVGDMSVFQQYTVGPSGRFLGPWFRNGNFRIGGDVSNEVLFEPVRTDGFYLITIVLDDGEASMYLDGEYAGYAGRLNNDIQQTEARIGGTYGYFDGLIDDVRLYDRVLSAEEIENLYEGHNVNEGIVGRWLFIEGEGSITDDISGNENHGTIINATWVTK